MNNADSAAASTKSLADKSQAGSKTIHVALVGNPNTGKSTLFSALCGIPTRIGNYPGVTVEEKFGSYKDAEGEVVVIDLPGTYSLSARTPDEFVSVDVLLGRRSTPGLDGVIVIADATNLERNLYLFTQVRQLGLPTVLVLNMWDRVAGSVDIDVPMLATQLGVRIVTTAASRHQGVAEVKQAVREALASGRPAEVDILPPEFVAERDRLREWLATRSTRPIADFVIERMILDVGGQAETEHGQQAELAGLSTELSATRARLAEMGLRVPAVETKARYAWIRQQISGCVARREQTETTTSDRIDRILTHRWWA